MATLDTLYSLGKSVARGVPQLATGFVDLAALPLTMTGVRKPEQIFGSTAYLTEKGLLPPAQTGLLNQSTELASSMVNPATAAKGVSVGLLGTFIGKGSKLWNAESNSVAQALEKQGVAPETIWSQTGNVKAPDGKWRQEVSDAEAVGLELMSKDKSYKLPQAMQHEKLYEAYPELRNMNVALKEPGSSYLARDMNMIKLGDYSKDFLNSADKKLYNQEKDAIYKEAQKLQDKGLLTAEKDLALNKQLDDIEYNYISKAPSYYPKENSLLHEVQHQIQETENFGRGGSPSQFITFDKNLMSIQDATKKYKSLLGEAESRLTENRLPLSQGERMQYYPYAYGTPYGLDIPYNELLVQGLLK
jgi:hypothetical protein